MFQSSLLTSGMVYVFYSVEEALFCGSVHHTTPRPVYFVLCCGCIRRICPPIARAQDRAEPAVRKLSPGSSKQVPPLPSKMQTQEIQHESSWRYGIHSSEGKNHELLISFDMWQQVDNTTESLIPLHSNKKPFGFFRAAHAVANPSYDNKHVCIKRIHLR